MARWVGLVGRAGVGKDHTGRELARVTGGRLVRVSFADEVRYEIEEYLNGGEQLGVLWAKPYSEPVRRLMQWWGTDFRRVQDSEYWVKKGVERGKAVDSHGFVPVFTDVRFMNEAQAVYDHGGFLVRVEATTAARLERLGELPPEHGSESESDMIITDESIWSEESNVTYEEQVKALAAQALGS